MRILVIDIDENTKFKIKEIFKDNKVFIDEIKRKEFSILNCEKKDFDVVIWDTSLSILNCTKECEFIRNIKQRFTHSLIYILSSDVTQEKINKCFKYGAHDFIKKPFNEEEFFYRIKNRIYFIEEMFYILKEKRAVRIENREVQLTETEFKLLKFLFKNKNTELSREKIMEKVWNSIYIKGERTVDSIIRNLRKKDCFLYDRIKSIRNKGYIFVL